MLKLFWESTECAFELLDTYSGGDLKIPRYDRKEGEKKEERRENMLGGNSFSVRGLVESEFLFLLPCGGKFYFWGLRYIAGMQLFSHISLWKELNMKGIISLICGDCFKLNFD